MFTYKIYLRVMPDNAQDTTDQTNDPDYFIRC